MAIKTLFCAGSGDKEYATGASERQRGFQCHKLVESWACQSGGMKVAFLEEVDEEKGHPSCRSQASLSSEGLVRAWDESDEGGKERMLYTAPSRPCPWSLP